MGLYKTIRTRPCNVIRTSYNPFKSPLSPLSPDSFPRSQVVVSPDVGGTKRASARLPGGKFSSVGGLCQRGLDLVGGFKHWLTMVNDG
jgi:hypothetical protein